MLVREVGALSRQSNRFGDMAPTLTTGHQLRRQAFTLPTGHLLGRQGTSFADKHSLPCRQPSVRLPARLPMRLSLLRLLTFDRERALFFVCNVVRTPHIGTRVHNQNTGNPSKTFSGKVCT